SAGASLPPARETIDPFFPDRLPPHHRTTGTPARTSSHRSPSAHPPTPLSKSHSPSRLLPFGPGPPAAASAARRDTRAASRNWPAESTPTGDAAASVLD